MPAPASLQAMSANRQLLKSMRKRSNNPFRKTQVHVRGSLEANDKQAEKHTAPAEAPTASQPRRPLLSLVCNSSGAALVLALWRFWCPKTSSLANVARCCEVAWIIWAPKPRINRSVKRYAKVGETFQHGPLNALLRTFLRCRSLA